MQIAISGNIGAGKTELTKLLSRHYGYRAIYGPSEDKAMVFPVAMYGSESWTIKKAEH